MTIDQWLSASLDVISFLGFVVVIIQLRDSNRQAKLESQIRLYDINRELIAMGFSKPELFEVLKDEKKADPNNPVDTLSPREREVLLLIADGKTNKEIATKLNLSVYTVDSHRGKIMEKLNLHSAGELVRFAIKKGLVD